MTAIETTLSLDTSGKCCPMPMVETNRAIKSIAQGDILKIIATDPGTQKDIPSWCERTGHELISVEVSQDLYIYFVKKQQV